MKREFSAGVVVFYRHKETIEYLLLHYESGHWDFPKGHIEKGETKQETALRELQEEAGITANLIAGFEESFEYFFKNAKTHELINKTVYFFVGQTHTKKITLSHEHIGYEWLEYKQALKKITYKNAQNLLKKIHAFLQNN